MANRLRLAIVFSLVFASSIASAELLNFQCSFYGEFPIGVTIDDQARTVSAKGDSYDLGGGSFKVLKITKNAIWLVARERDADEDSLKIAVLQRSIPGNRKKGGALRTAVMSEGAEINSDASPRGVCWELQQKQP